MSQDNIPQEFDAQYKGVLTQLAIVANFVPCCFNRNQIHSHQVSFHNNLKYINPYSNKDKEGRMLHQPQVRNIRFITCMGSAIQSEPAALKTISYAKSVEDNIQ